MLNKSPTLANLENDHEFIIKEYYLMRPLGKLKGKP